MAYNRVNWKNEGEGVTPLNATNLNVMDQGIAQLDAKMSVVEQYARPATYSQAGVVKPDGNTLRIDRNGKLVAVGGGGGTGGGDMYKAIYDSDDDGIVDAANCLQDGTNVITASYLSEQIEKGYLDGGKNLFNPNAVLKNHTYNATTGALETNSTISCTEKIKVKNGSIYFSGVNASFRLYRWSENAYLSTEIITLPCKIDVVDGYIAINFVSTLDLSKLMIEVGSQATTFQPYAKSNVELTEELGLRTITPNVITGSIIYPNVIQYGKVVSVNLGITLENNASIGTKIISNLPKAYNNNGIAPRINVLNSNNLAGFVDVDGTQLEALFNMQKGITYVISGTYIAE